MHNITDITGRQHLITLEENTGSSGDIQLRKEVVILCKNESICLPSIRGDCRVTGSKLEVGHSTNSFDIMIELSQIVDRRSLDIFVSEQPVSH